MKKFKKLIAVLLTAAMLCTAGCAANEPTTTPSEENSSVSSTSDTTSQDNSSQSSDSTPSSDNDGQTEGFGGTSDSDTSNAPAESPLTVSYTNTNSWEEGGKHCSQLDFTIKNTSSEIIRGWKLTLDFAQDTEFVQSWNTSITANGNTAIAENVDYNADLPSGTEVTFGIIVRTTEEIGTVNITANGEQVGTTGDFDSNESQSTTTAATTQPAAPDIDIIETTAKSGLVSECGQLSVKGTDLVDKNGDLMQLRGVSTHGIQWFPQFANKDAFRHLRDEWNINVIRLAMYTGAGEGYTDSTKANIEKTVQDAVDACIELDMYVIVDWHILQDQSPQVRKADSLRFFEYMSKKYADYPNIIYEICNEPNGYASWQGDVKPYAEEVIPVIRKNDPDSIVIVGTPTWCQDIDKAWSDPLDYDNIMYALHYYAATHTDWLRDRLKNCHNSGMPIIVSEFGNCDASGNGYNDFAQAEKWLELLDSLNISYMNWSLCDKNERASLLNSGASPTGGWSDSDLSENGKFMKEWFRNHN